MKNLVQLFKKNGITIDQNQEKQFDKFFRDLVETNEKFNLTAITDEKEVAVKHFLDSCLAESLIPKDCRVVDVGSGAGFPAIPLKIIRPDLEFCLVDSLNKRVQFLENEISVLKLTKISAEHARVEDFAKKNREKFDVAVARAVAPLNTLVEYLLPLIKVGGIAIVYKATKLETELLDAKKAIRVLGGEVENIKSYEINSEIEENQEETAKNTENVKEKFERKLLIIKKVSQSPIKYPRSGNKPKLDPIK